MTEFNKVFDVEFDGIQTWDAPDFCDAFVVSASWENGTKLTEEELDLLNEDSDYVHELLFDYLY